MPELPETQGQTLTELAAGEIAPALLGMQTCRLDDGHVNVNGPGLFYALLPRCSSAETARISARPSK